MNLRALVLLVLALACALPAPSVRARCAAAPGTVPALAAAVAGDESCCGTECHCTPESCACARPDREPAPAEPTLPPAPREPFSLPMLVLGPVPATTVPPVAPPLLAQAARPRAPPVAVHVRHCVWRT